MTALETAARNFVVSPKAGRQRERHRATVLTLSAKDATFSQIQDLLIQHGIIVSESSITRFCRMHRAEIQRLRVQRKTRFKKSVILSEGGRPNLSVAACRAEVETTVLISKRNGGDLSRESSWMRSFLPSRLAIWREVPRARRRGLA